MDIEQTYQLAYQMRCDGRYGDAKQLFQRILSAQPNHVNSRHQLALILGFEGDFDGSLAALQGLYAQAPNNLDILFDLAMTEMMLGMYEEGCVKMKYILVMNPAHEKAQQQVGFC